MNKAYRETHYHDMLHYLTYLKWRHAPGQQHTIAAMFSAANAAAPVDHADFPPFDQLGPDTGQLRTYGGKHVTAGWMRDLVEVGRIFALCFSLLAFMFCRSYMLAIEQPE